MNGQLWAWGLLGVVATGCGGSSAMKEPSYTHAAVDASPGGSPAPATAMGTEMGEAMTSQAPAHREQGASMDVAPPQESRPGLGTSWGETRSSSISTAPFVRADDRSPFAMGALYYNDEEGARSMASFNDFRRSSEGVINLGDGVASARLKGGSGRFLTGFESSGKNFAIGQAGDRYSIVIESHVPARLEVVVSVDGLDVLDGKAGSFEKRGYIIDPHGSIEIDGFRTSMDAVAAFRFGSVRDSYADKKTGDSRNVGVIGVALFNERGTQPSSWPRGDTRNRLNADPFPGRFATPPPN